MTAVAEIDADPESSFPPSEDQLLDVLYEVLAQGVPPRSKLTREEVERFLHEHAREKKPIAELVSFFERHELPLDASQYGVDRELVELASGLVRERSSLVPGFVTPAPLHAPSPPQQPPPLHSAEPRPEPGAMVEGVVEGEATGRHVLARTPAMVRLRRLAWIGAIAALGLLGAFLVSYERANSLEQRLEHARMQQLSTDVALTKLEQRAESLRGELRLSEDERRFLSARFEAVLAEEAKKRATEEQALEHVLGARYRKLREKLAAEAATAEP